jgi:hypothetical protein
MIRSKIKVRRYKDGKLVDAILISGVSMRQAELAQIKWQTVANQCIQKLIVAGVPEDDRPEHIGWDWRAKHKKYGRLVAYRFYGIECDGAMQGLMLLNVLFRSSRIASQKDQQIIYGVYLASAPWNLKQFMTEPVYSLIGSVLIAAAIQVSQDEGCEGRLGLHALKQSERFYKSCGMTDLGIDEEHDNRLRYFEMTTTAAIKFLSEGK